MLEIPIRIMHFEFSPAEVKQSIPGSIALLGASFALPYLEPYLIRTMREALNQTTDDQVAEEVKHFIGQEAQHYRQHAKLNELVCDIYPSLAGIKIIEGQMAADYQRFTSTKSLKFNLAYAEGFEAVTCAASRTLLMFIDIGALNTDFKRFWIWHMNEEIEHRTVTFNIYHHLYGDYLYRLLVGLYGQYHFFKYVFRFSWHIHRHLPKQSDNASNVFNAKENKKKGFKVLGYLLKNWLPTYLPWYNPAKIELPKKHYELSKFFSDRAREVRG